MLKKINASAIIDRLQALRPSRQTLLRRLKQGGVAVIAFGGLYVIAPPLWEAISVSPQQRLEPLKQRINDLDKQIKTSKAPLTTDLKEIATLEKGRIDSENTIRTSLFQAVGGLLVFVTLYISWLTLKANEAKQVAERFSKAVEQLGNDNIHTRLGGIYALEQIAKDAEEKYYWQVMETLTSYVRVRSPWNQEKEAQAEQEIPPLPTDIQAVMTVLARRKHSCGHPLERHPLDLHGADLRRLQLTSEAKFCRVNFSESNLQEATFVETDLQEAIFSRAELNSSTFLRVNLQKASFNNTRLQFAKLWESEIQNAWFLFAELRYVSFDDSVLKRSIFSSSNLELTNFDMANLQGVLFTNNANLQKAKFEGANLNDADLRQGNGFTVEQLRQVASYEGACLPDDLRKQIT